MTVTQQSVAGPWALHPSASAGPEWSSAREMAYRRAFQELAERGGALPGEPFRVAFLGQQNYFGPTSLPALLPGLQSTFIHHVPGESAERAVAAVGHAAPHLLVVYRPELMGAVLDAVDVPISVGMFTEPLPVPGHARHPDLERRWADLQRLDPGSCDYYVGFNPLFRPAWERLVPVLTCMPLPVCDDIFVPVAALKSPDPRSGFFVGRVTEERNRYLLPLKHVFDWTVIDHGMRDVAPYSMAINLHNEDYPNFENRVPLHLARGHLVLTQPLTPGYDLFDGITHLTFKTPEELNQLVRQIDERRTPFLRIAARGRLAAEAFRASTLWCDRFTDIALRWRGGIS